MGKRFPATAEPGEQDASGTPQGLGSSRHASWVVWRMGEEIQFWCVGAQAPRFRHGICRVGQASQDSPSVGQPLERSPAIACTVLLAVPSFCKASLRCSTASRVGFHTMMSHHGCGAGCRACLSVVPSCKAVCLEWLCHADGTIVEFPSAMVSSVNRGLAPTHLGPAA